MYAYVLYMYVHMHICMCPRRGARLPGGGYLGRGHLGWHTRPGGVFEPSAAYRVREPVGQLHLAALQLSGLHRTLRVHLPLWARSDRAPGRGGGGGGRRRGRFRRRAQRARGDDARRVGRLPRRRSRDRGVVAMYGVVAIDGVVIDGVVTSGRVRDGVVASGRGLDGVVTSGRGLERVVSCGRGFLEAADQAGEARALGRAVVAQGVA